MEEVAGEGPAGGGRGAGEGVEWRLAWGERGNLGVLGGGKSWGRGEEGWNKDGTRL